MGAHCPSGPNGTPFDQVARHTLGKALHRYAVPRDTARLLNEYYDEIEAAIRENIPAGFTFAGVNPDCLWQGEREVAAYVVDVQGAASDPTLLLTEGRDAYEVVMRAQNNCVAWSSVIVCDVRFLWRQMLIAAHFNGVVYNRVQPASRLVLPTLPDDLQAERSLNSWGQRFDFLDAVARRLGEERYPLTSRWIIWSFSRFLILHELAHIALGHTVGNALAPCGFASPPEPERLRGFRVASVPLDDAQLARELDADKVGVTALFKDTYEANEQRPAEEAAALMIWGLHVADVYESIVDIGRDPRAWTPHNNAGDMPRFRKRFQLRACGASHPTLVARYLNVYAELFGRDAVTVFGGSEVERLWIQLRALSRSCSSAFDSDAFVKSVTELRSAVRTPPAH